MKISVIIPVYNVEQYLHECVDSVLEQSYSNFELILVDDGSCDRSGIICDEYAQQDTRIKVIHKSNGGLSDARNVGLASAIGEYLIFLDSDDKWQSQDFLQKLIDVIAIKSYDLVLFRTQGFTDKQCYSVSKPYSKSCFVEDKLETLRLLLKSQSFPTSAWSKFIKTSILKDKNIRFKKGLLGEDMDWNLKMLPNVSSFYFCNEAVYGYRQRDNSITTTYKIKNAQDFCWILQSWKMRLEQKLTDENVIYLGYLANLYVTFVYQFFNIKKEDRIIIKQEVLDLSSLLSYSITLKSKRLLWLKRLLGKRLMLYICGLYGHLR